MNNLIIKVADKADKELVAKVVDVHLAAFKGFFLTFLGSGFLKQMYLAYIMHQESGLLFAVNGDEVVGFLAYSERLSDLYKFMIKKSLIPFAWYGFCAFLRKPSVFLRLVRALAKPKQAQKEENYIKIASIGVSPTAKMKGVGTQLIDALKDSVDREAFKYIELETDAIDNDAANKFYEKNGFHIVREFETREKRKMYEYRYELI